MGARVQAIKCFDILENIICMVYQTSVDNRVIATRHHYFDNQISGLFGNHISGDI
jgi:hypothetical protein